MAAIRAQSPGGSSSGGDGDALDVGLATIELQKLQRQFRLMEGDRKAYTDETKMQIGKQRYGDGGDDITSALQSLRRENAVLRSDLRLLERRRDAQAKECMAEDETGGGEGRKMRRLEEEAEVLLRKLRASHHTLSRLASRTAMCERDVAAARAEELRAGPRLEHEEKARRVLENRLDKSLAKFSTALSHNKALRTRVESLLRERGVYDAARRRLDRDLRESKAGMAETIESSNAAYETRDDAQTRLLTLREKADKEYQAYLVEMKDLGRILEQDRKLKEFMSTKAADRTAIARERMAQIMARQAERAREESTAAQGDAAGQKSVPGAAQAAQAEQTRYDLDEVLGDLREATGQDNVGDMVTRFCELEDQSFSLFNYVNEVQDECERLSDEIARVEDSARKATEVDKADEEERGRRVAVMEVQLAADKRKVEQYRSKATDAAAGLSGMLEKVEALVASVRVLAPLEGCNIRFELPVDLVADPLGPPDAAARVTFENVLAYLKFVEGKANDMLLANYLLSVPRNKDGEDGAGEDSGLTETEAREKERKEKEALGGLLGRGPKEALGEIKPVVALPTAEDYDSAEEVDRPLTRADFERMTTEKFQKKHSAKSATGGAGGHGAMARQGPRGRKMTLRGPPPMGSGKRPTAPTQ
ncbi:hypothetical protein M427DRAFT_28236 [Gonapodya prolifera JEL478]|uniref:ODAD1 central coiled coil region domain-containing protein n=1 Tax=Gonapodya prolifera (strain JEL478) TaxID=1344416 RepID=A0A139AVC8_GONPJ|nr:hypothetical protein M427DRAFT_28236 [Gonapodya prolifera JEL478]|eukprot:KXS20533.1 hypothetical protein M427DRAFT_28236 [Gonapodya prolifera JEL478]